MQLIINEYLINIESWKLNFNLILIFINKQLKCNDRFCYFQVILHLKNENNQYFLLTLKNLFYESMETIKKVSHNYRKSIENT